MRRRIDEGTKMNRANAKPQKNVHIMGRCQDSRYASAHATATTIRGAFLPRIHLRQRQGVHQAPRRSQMRRSHL